MKIPFIDLRPAHRKLESRILAAMRDVYRRNDFILGEQVASFEREFADFCGAQQAIGVSSGASALFLSLRALGVGPGDGVLTTPFTFFATASVIAAAGARPEFVDIDPNTLNIDPGKLESSRSRRTRAIMPVHLYGRPAQMDEIMRTARRRKLAVVEDACQAHGARFHGKTVGTFGDTGCFSFYPTKNLGGFGDGGMILASKAGLADRLRRLRNCGRRKPYEHIELGYNERLDALQAAGLRIKLRYLAEWTRQRRALAAVYQEELQNSPVRLLINPPGCEPVYHVFAIRAPRRDALREFMGRNGIATNIFYPIPLHLQKAFRNLGYRHGDFPEAEAASRDVLSLPLYPGLSALLARRVARTIKKFYEQNGA